MTSRWGSPAASGEAPQGDNADLLLLDGVKKAITIYRGGAVVGRSRARVPCSGQAPPVPCFPPPGEPDLP